MEFHCGMTCGNLRLTVQAGSGVSDLWRKAVARLASLSNRAASVDARHLLLGRESSRRLARLKRQTAG